MLLLLLTWVVVWLVLIALLWLGTLFIQGYIYSEPETDLHWRAPAAGSALAFFLLIWCFLAYKWPGDYDTLFRFSPTRTTVFDEFTATRKLGNQESQVVYRKETDSQGRPVYMSGGRPFTRGDSTTGMVVAIVVDENGEKAVFKPELTSEGHFKIDPYQSLRFLEEDGSREMTEASIGVIQTTSWLVIIATLLLNFIHFCLWVVVLWLLLHFQFWHAFGLGAVSWAVMTIAVLPLLLDRAIEAASPPLPETPEITRRIDELRHDLASVPPSAARPSKVPMSA